METLFDNHTLKTTTWATMSNQVWQHLNIFYEPQFDCKLKQTSYNDQPVYDNHPN